MTRTRDNNKMLVEKGAWKQGPSRCVGGLTAATRPATLSNCWEFLKLLLPSRGGNPRGGQDNDLGYGENAKDATMDNQQPSPKGGGPPTGGVPPLRVQFTD